MYLVATTYDLSGEPVSKETVHLSDTSRIDQMQITHLRLGLEVSIITPKGRVDYKLAARTGVRA